MGRDLMIVEKIFHKDITNLEESDVDNIIGIPETRSVEFKQIQDINPSLDHSEKKRKKINDQENILKSVIGFLNTNDSGLLVLGVKTVDEIANSISGVNKDVLKQLQNEISLEDFLKEKIKSIPSFLHEFKLETKIVDYHGRLIIFIEVLNKNWDRFYYSSITQYAYIREGKSANLIPLEDTLKIIADRSYPQVNVSFIERGMNKNGDKIYPNYRINFINNGVKVAKKVHCFILIGSEEKIDMSPFGGSKSSPERLDINKLDLDDFLKNHNYIEIFHFIFPTERMKVDKIYPFTNYSSGYIAILEQEVELIEKIITLTLEEHGLVRQEFRVLKKGRTSFEEIIREFNPYITL